MSRSKYSQISARTPGFVPFNSTIQFHRNLFFWINNLLKLTGRKIWFKPSGVTVAFSDGSDTGYGGFVVELGLQVAAQGMWSSDKGKNSCMYSEILAVR